MPLFQNESKCETFHLKMSSTCSFIFMQIKVIFKTYNGFALRLALKQRYKRTWKWPILCLINNKEASIKVIADILVSS